MSQKGHLEVLSNKPVLQSKISSDVNVYPTVKSTTQPSLKLRRAGVKIFNYALTSQQIKTEMNSGAVRLNSHYCHSRPDRESRCFWIPAYARMTLQVP